MLQSQMLADSFWKLLELSPGADAEEIRKAWYAAAKKNHPDLFPPEEHDRQTRIMMKLNEAYLALRADSLEDTGGEERRSMINRMMTDAKRPGHAFFNDLSWAWYRLGYDFHTRGRALLNSRRELSNLSSLTTKVSGDKGALQAAAAALREFGEAWDCLAKAVELGGAGAAGAADEMRKLEASMRIYRRICEAVSERAAV